MNSEGEVHSSIGFQDAETLIHVFDSQSLGIKPNFVSRYLEDTYVSQAQSGTSQSRTISGAAESDPDPNPSTDPSLDPDPDP